jgi:hypothetical protein
VMTIGMFQFGKITQLHSLITELNDLVFGCRLLYRWLQ